MNTFKTLFGIDNSSIKETCVIIPFFSKEILKGFKVDKLNKGMIFSTGCNDIFSLICTGMGSAFAGDAVLHLEDTKCKNIIFFGSCGITKASLLKRESITIVQKALSKDSFTDMILNKKALDLFYPDKDLLNILKKALDPVICSNVLTIGSIKLEESYLDRFKDLDCDIVDMETAAVFAAASSINKKAAAILFTTDHIKEFPYYTAFKKENLPIIKETAYKAASTVYKVIADISCFA
ncbi:MAG: hypothetical protein KAI43_01145 [Candidatus Aureabacteria bacterium]|nr:hypothetical protein [Candidatus Auribacterota bacterium]